ncbi:MAG: aminotransferase class V-fold PLP-dependent enzyme [Acidimicrobiales bacterium]
MAPGFPAEGRPVDDLLTEIRAGRGDDADWRGGRTFSLVYNPADPELERLLEAVSHDYLHENYLNPFAFPSLLKMEQEVVGMAADLFGGSADAGKLTSGGTESIFLAVQVAREHARQERGIAEPQLVTGTTAHPAFAKAAHYLDVEHVLVPVAADGRLDPAAAAHALTDRTALLVGSAPSYPFGVMDPIPDLAALASSRDVLCHVDACLGGWLLPFWERLGEPVPPWDLRVPGVTSLSADIHKYGWSFKGVSLLLHRSRDLLKHQYFIYDAWPGGVYGSATTAGTRPGAPIAAAWATVSHLGEAGYLRLAAQVLDATRLFRAGIEAIDGLRITGAPVMGVMEIASDVHDMSAIGDVMDDRGWHLDRQQGGLHLMLSPYHATVATAFVADLGAAVAEHGESRGVEARYGGGPGDAG